MARVWQRLQDFPSAGDPAERDQAPLVESAPKGGTDPGDSTLPFIEVGVGGSADASTDVRAHMKGRSPSGTTRINRQKTRNAQGWHWPDGITAWPEIQIVRNILDTIATRVEGSALVGYVASESISTTTLTRLLVAISHQAAKDDCPTLLVSGDLPIPVGMPKAEGIRDHLAGKASINDVCHVSADGKAALLSGGCHHAHGPFDLQVNTFQGMLKTLRRHYSLIIGEIHQSQANSLSTTFLDESDGAFVVAAEGEDFIVERWQRAMAHQGITYLGWIVVKSTATCPSQSNPWQSHTDWPRAG